MTLTKALDYGKYPVSWAGPGRTPAELCLGTEDGKVLFFDGEPRNSWGVKPPPEGLHEAVNGVACAAGIIGVSSRAEVAFYQAEPGQTRIKRAAFAFGAHGIVAEPGGLFTAPGGLAGLFMARLLPPGDVYQVRVIRPSDERLDFYKAITLKADAGLEVIACAGRRMGILAVLYSEKESEDTIFGFEHVDVDVIDLCSLHDKKAPNGVCGIGKNGVLVYCPDVLVNRQPITLRLNEMVGLAYRLLRHGPHLVVLTSKAFYVLIDLAQRLIDDEQDWRHIRVLELPMQAIDMNPFGDRCVIVGTGREINFFDFASVRDENGQEAVGHVTLGPPIKVRRSFKAARSELQPVA